MIVTFELDGKQGALEIVHSKTFVPDPKPVTLVFGNNEFVIIPVPEISVQAPAPAVGKFPFRIVLGEEIQSV